MLSEWPKYMNISEEQLNVILKILKDQPSRPEFKEYDKVQVGLERLHPTKGKDLTAQRKRILATGFARQGFESHELVPCHGLKREHIPEGWILIPVYDSGNNHILRKALPAFYTMLWNSWGAPFAQPYHKAAKLL